MRNIKLIKIICLAVVLIMGLSFVTACNNNEASIDGEVQYVISNKTSNYFDKSSERSDLLAIVRSKSELSRILKNNNCSLSEQYSISYFSNKSLILCFFKSKIYNEVEMSLTVSDNTLIIGKTYLYPDGAAIDALRYRTLIFEVDKSRVKNINKIQWA